MIETNKNNNLLNNSRITGTQIFALIPVDKPYVGDSLKNIKILPY